MKKIFLMNIATAIAFLFLINTTACNSSKKVTTAQTQSVKKELIVATSAQCGECKSRIEGALSELKGVKKATLNLDDKTVKVVYDSTLTTPEAIKTAINNIGYDADTQPANASAYEKLPACCKKGGHEK